MMTFLCTVINAFRMYIVHCHYTDVVMKIPPALGFTWHCIV